MDWYLRAKHWQLALIYGIIIGSMPLLYLIFIINLIRDFGNDIEPTTLSVFPFWFLIPIILMLVYSHTYFWTLGNRLYDMAPKPLSLKRQNYRIAVIFPLAFSVTTLLVLSFIFSTTTFDQSSIFPFLIFFLPSLAFTMLCGFYQIYFLARLVKSLELNREANMEECWVEAILFWFFFIGIWIIQPKVNEYYEKSLNNSVTER